jgi:tetratricopeptide (TPR) repeat protein
LKRHLLAVACVVAVPYAAHDAVAQPAKVDPQQKARTAKQYVDAGLAAQNAKDYETAISLYTKAYALVPHPVLLFNIGQAHRLAGRIDQAVRFYQQYLDADPKGTQAATARDLLAEIKAREAAVIKQREDARKADEARKAEAARRAEEARKAEAAEAARLAAAPSEPSSDASTEPTDEVAVAHPGRTLRIAGMSAAGVGVVATGLAIVYGLNAREASDDLSAPGASYDPAYVEYGETSERRAILLGVTGGALIAGGVVMYMLGHNQQTADAERVTLHVRTDFVGVAFGGVLP